MEIVNSRVHNLTWTHIRHLLRVDDEKVDENILDSDSHVVKDNDFWIRNRGTLEFLGTWEIIHNPHFNVVEFDHFRIQAGLPSLSSC